MLFTMLALVGCGSEEGVPGFLVDPTNQLPAHVNWNSYNLYRYHPQTRQWNPVVTLGTQVAAIPQLAGRPVMLTHGLGGNIRNNELSGLAQNLIDFNLATDVFGFEYDSQDAISKNGGFYRTALNLVTGAQRQQWALISHSMGGLVTRVAIQAGPLPVADTGNRAIFLGTPHLGSEVVSRLQDTSNLAIRSSALGSLNHGGFINANGEPSEVVLSSQGFTDLRPDSPFLAVLNQTGNVHPQFRYFTIAGTRKGEFQTVNDVLQVDSDDGLVTLLSANPPAIAAEMGLQLPVTHTQLDDDPEFVFPAIRQLLTLPQALGLTQTAAAL